MQETAMAQDGKAAAKQNEEEEVISVSELRKTFYTGFAPYRGAHFILSKLSPRLAQLLTTKVQAVQDLSFSVRSGEIFGLLGPNGAGKTTTIKMMMGLIHADHGSIRLFGRSITDPAAKRRIGFLPENPYFYDYLRPQEFLDLAARLTDVPSSIRKRRIEEMLELTGLTKAKDRPLRKFSKGMLQRIGIAQAMINDPDLIVLDEPLSGLDPIGRKEIRDIITELGSRGKTVLFSSHILSDVEIICHRVAILMEGRLTSVGRLDQLLRMEVHKTEVVLDKVKPELVQQLDVKVDQVVCIGERVQVMLQSGVQVDEFLEEVLGKGASVVSISPIRRSLEDLFMDQAIKAGKGKDAAS